MHRPAASAERRAVGRRRPRRPAGASSGRGSARSRSTTSHAANYFDSIYHSAAVVGINTSAQIESAIVGRPVHTVLADEFQETQQGTLHFQYLKADEFGHLYVGRTIEEHLEQLEESLRGGMPTRPERALPPALRPAARARRAGDAPSSSRHRGAGCASDAGTGGGACIRAGRAAGARAEAR